MNKVSIVTRITSDVLDRYRNSIPRKAFVQAMERVVELAFGTSEPLPPEPSPGLVLLRSSELTPEQLAQQICGACPPFPLKGHHPCYDQDCRVCWQSWLTTGLPPHYESEADQ